MRFNKVASKVFLIAGFATLILAVKFYTPIKDFWNFQLEKLGIYSDNFFASTGAEMQRKRPVSMLERETDLKLYIGEPFRSFSLREWGKFWDLMYGVFPKQPSGEGLPNKMRQLDEGELADELAKNYPEPFETFQPSHWRSFFDIAFKKK